MTSTTDASSTPSTTSAAATADPAAAATTAATTPDASTTTTTTTTTANTCNECVAPPQPPSQTACAKKTTTKSKLSNKPVNRKRCYTCRKKVGLAGGIECKCGFVFCSKHRYPDQHACTFDFKAHDRAQLAKDVVGGGVFAKVERV